MAIHTENVDVICKTLPPEDHSNIPIINQPNPCYAYPINADQLWQLIWLSNYYIYQAGTSQIISGTNYYDYFPERGGGGGGGMTPTEVQNMIDQSLVSVDERLDKVEDDIDHINNAIVVYEKGEEISVGKIVYITAGQLYQADRTFTSNNDPELTLEQSLQYDITHGNLKPVTDAEIGDLGERVDELDEWKPTVDEDIAYLKQAVVSAEEVEFYDTFEEFPEEGVADIIYVDRSTNNNYMWNSTNSEYEIMNENNIASGTMFTSSL